MSFTTFYISPDVFNYSSPFEHASFRSKVINDPILWDQFNMLKNLCDTSRTNTTITSDFLTAFNQTVLDLTNRHGHDQSFERIEPSLPLNTVKAYIVRYL